jgi:hypothetical protein
MRHLLLGIVFCFGCLLCRPSLSYAQYDKKNLEAKRIQTAPDVDGFLTESVWNDAPIAGGFVMDSPTPGIPLSQNTEVRVLYDHEAMYIGISCFDNNPDSIYSQLSGRDGSGNTDYCGVTFSCYRDGINGFTFITNAKGEQYDARMSSDGEDVSWNAVWYCKTKITSQGWFAEFKIPFAAIRFPDKPEQLWNINFVREVRRHRHHGYWNGVDPMLPGFLTQMGTLTGIKNIKPPRRIFFYPYTSSYYNVSPDASGKNRGSFSYNAGLDMKFGLSDAFTLDATLVPDFGQTISDQQILNLSAYEIQFADNRQFFIEGTELFSKAGVFYSRRIGFDSPFRSSDAFNKLKQNERLIENPSKDHVVNAIKISGRDKKNLGIGFFNAVTAPSYASARDTITGEVRKIGTSALTNYNVFVLDQILPNNSYVSIINTSVMRAGEDYDVDVLASEFEVRNKENKYSISGSGALNSKFGKSFSGPEVKNDNGFKQSVQLNKIDGQFRWALGEATESDTYDPTDLGFLAANNSARYWAMSSYNIYKPFGRFNNFWSNLYANYNQLYNPNHFTSLEFSADGGITTRKFQTWGFDWSYNPIRGFDYFEPRVWGRYFRTYKSNLTGVWFSSDYRKKVALDASIYVSMYENKDRRMFNWRVAPRFRLNDHLFITYVYSFQSHIRDIGFAYNFEDGLATKPLFGIRDVISHTNVLNVKYAFNPYMTLNTRVRHYWGYTKFREFRSLLEDGYLGETSAKASNQSFNSFTIDMIYSWIFRPGSELSIVWKNAIIDFRDVVPSSLVNDLDYTVSLPQNNTISLKLIYFLDYHMLADRLAGKNRMVN